MTLDDAREIVARMARGMRPTEERAVARMLLDLEARVAALEAQGGAGAPAAPSPPPEPPDDVRTPQAPQDERLYLH